jgi:ubiquinone/menaquinone biosynthesis C-methylase UbiE
MEKEIYSKIYELQKSGWWFGNARNNLVIFILKDLLDVIVGKKILDVGCSEGAFLDRLKTEKADFSAIDFDNQAIEFCRKRGYSKEVKFGSILDIPYKENSFDCVTALDVIEHIDDDNKALSEMKRVCKKNGIIFLILPAHKWLFSSNDEAYHHFRRYDLDRIKKIAKKNSLSIKAISYFNISLFPIFVLMTLITKIFPNKRTSSVLKPVPKPLNSMLSKIMNNEIQFVTRNVSHNKLGPVGSSYIVILKKSS